MKIKTISRPFKWLGEFDNLVNEALEDGWHLTKREVIPGAPNDLARVYAELVQMDEAPEPQPMDPFEALHIVRDACKAVPLDACSSNGCPMYDWCEQLRKGGDPTDWDLPKKEAPKV